VSTEPIQFEQGTFPFGKQSFTIRADGELEVEIKRIGLHRKFTIPLWQINPRSDQLSVRAHGALVGTVVFAIGSILSILGIVRAQNENTWAPLIFPALVCTVFLAICFWKYTKNSYNGTIFYVADGSNLFFRRNKDRLKALEEFCKTLSKSAAEAIASREQAYSTSLAGEILALQKLQERGILALDEFQRAKERLIGTENKRHIGFAPQPL